MIKIVFNGTKEGLKRLLSLGKEDLSKALGVKVTAIEPDWDKLAEEEHQKDQCEKGVQVG